MYLCERNGGCVLWNSEMKRINHYIAVVVIVVMTGLMSACHSSKSASRGSSYVPRTDLKMEIDKDMEPIRRDLLVEAQSWIGTKYKYGGHSRSGTDCSGMIMEIYFNTTGIKLPRNSGEQKSYCREIHDKDMMPGDLVFFSNGGKNGRIGHVGMYVGNGQMIHASGSRGVMISLLEEKYWQTHYAGAGRVEAFSKLLADNRKSGKKSKKEKKKEKKSEDDAPPFEYTKVAALPGQQRAKAAPAPPEPVAVPSEPENSEKPDTVGVVDPQWFDLLR